MTIDKYVIFFIIFIVSIFCVLVLLTKTTIIQGIIENITNVKVLEDNELIKESVNKDIKQSNIYPSVLEVDTKPLNIEQEKNKEILFCKDLICIENNFSKCEISQYFENAADVVNSKGIAIFGNSDDNCAVVVSYDLKNSLKCFLSKDLLNKDVFYKLWSSDLYKIDSLLEKYCKLDVVK